MGDPALRASLAQQLAALRTTIVGVRQEARPSVNGAQGLHAVGRWLLERERFAAGQAALSRSAVGSLVAASPSRNP